MASELSDADLNRIASESESMTIALRRAYAEGAAAERARLAGEAVDVRGLALEACLDAGLDPNGERRTDKIEARIREALAAQAAQHEAEVAELRDERDRLRIALDRFHQIVANDGGYDQGVEVNGVEYLRLSLERLNEAEAEVAALRAKLHEIAEIVSPYAEDDGEDPIVGKVRELRECQREDQEMIAALRAKLAEAERLDALHVEYEALLVAELNETVPLAANHGWRSTRHERGVEMRATIDAAREGKP